MGRVARRRNSRALSVVRYPLSVIRFPLLAGLRTMTQPRPPGRAARSAASRRAARHRSLGGLRPPPDLEAGATAYNGPGLRTRNGSIPEVAQCLAGGVVELGAGGALGDRVAPVVELVRQALHFLGVRV